MKILIVDDEEMIRESLKVFFEAHGCTVDAAGSAEDALVRLDGFRPAVAIVDIRLPSKGGDQFIVEAKAKYPGLSFLIFTGSAEYALPLELRRIGLCAENVFQKPVADLAVLFNAAKRCVNRVAGNTP